MSTSLLLRSTLPRHIARQPTLVGAVWLRKARASTTAAPQEEGEFKYVPGGREFSLFPLSHLPRSPWSRFLTLFCVAVCVCLMMTSVWVWSGFVGLYSYLQGDRERSHDFPSTEQEPWIVPLGIREASCRLSPAYHWRCVRH